MPKLPLEHVVTVASPVDLFGDLLADVQLSRIFADGKTFVDCRPRRAPADLVADFSDVARDPTSLAAFVADNFDMPRLVVVPEPAIGRSLRDHIRLVWPALSRGPDQALPGSSQLAIPTRYLVPGGRFRELYYWDGAVSLKRTSLHTMHREL